LSAEDGPLRYGAAADFTTQIRVPVFCKTSKDAVESTKLGFGRLGGHGPPIPIPRQYIYPWQYACRRGRNNCIWHDGGTKTTPGALPTPAPPINMRAHLQTPDRLFPSFYVGNADTVPPQPPISPAAGVRGPYYRPSYRSAYHFWLGREGLPFSLIKSIRIADRKDRSKTTMVDDTTNHTTTRPSP